MDLAFAPCALIDPVTKRQLPTRYTVRLWRSNFARGGVDALRASIAPGPVSVRAQAALRVAAPLLSAPVEDRPNWTLSRLADEIARCEGLSISRSQLSKVLRKKGGSAFGGPGTR